MKRISMGTDTLVTDGRLADLLTEYARQLARSGTADTVVLPVAREGVAEQATVLLGPASQITLTESHDDEVDDVDLPDVEDVIADLRTAPRPAGRPRRHDRGTRTPATTSPCRRGSAEDEPDR